MKIQISNYTYRIKDSILCERSGYFKSHINLSSNPSYINLDGLGINPILFKYLINQWIGRNRIVRLNPELYIEFMRLREYLSVKDTNLYFLDSKIRINWYFNCYVETVFVDNILYDLDVLYGDAPIECNNHINDCLDINLTYLCANKCSTWGNIHKPNTVLYINTTKYMLHHSRYTVRFGRILTGIKVASILESNC